VNTPRNFMYKGKPCVAVRYALQPAFGMPDEAGFVGFEFECEGQRRRLPMSPFSMPDKPRFLAMADNELEALYRLAMGEA
jgi:hypothetical protein